MPTLIRFADYHYNYEFLKKGTIWMNKLSVHKNNELNEIRGDALEGISALKNPHFFEFYLEDNKTKTKKLFASTHPSKKEVAKIEKPIIAVRNNDFDGNVFCMTVIDDSWLELNNKFDPKINGFFNEVASMVVFKEEGIPIFLNKVKEEVNKLGFLMKYNRVTYYDESVDQSGLGVFHKKSAHSYQNEFRIFVQRTDDGPLVFNIGSIEDIAELYIFEGNSVEYITLLKG